MKLVNLTQLDSTTYYMLWGVLTRSSCSGGILLSVNVRVCLVREAAWCL